MKRLLTTLFVAFFFSTITTITFAEEEGHGGQTFVNPKIPCNSWDSVSQSLTEQYHEFPIAEGTSALTMQDDKVFGGDLVFFVNKDTATYTVVVHFSDVNLGCIVGAGENFGPVNSTKYLKLYGAVEL